METNHAKLLKVCLGPKCMVELRRCKTGEEYLRVIRKNQRPLIFWKDVIDFARIPTTEGRMDRMAFMVSKLNRVPVIAKNTVAKDSNVEETQKHE
jgi:hypothetical protein